MIEGLENLNRKWQTEGRPRLKIGVGINTGGMLFGDMGSEQRRDSTVIGDSLKRQTGKAQRVQEAGKPMTVAREQAIAV